MEETCAEYVGHSEGDNLSLVSRVPNVSWQRIFTTSQQSADGSCFCMSK